MERFTFRFFIKKKKKLQAEVIVLNPTCRTFSVYELLQIVKVLTV